ncbi:MAG TPA: hypothetical protein VH500_01170 [Nitrososphaeraceae archaeon]
MKTILCGNLSDHKSQSELRFSEISPMWSERLNQARDNISPFAPIRSRWYRELTISSACVVGEAYGFSSSYVHKCKTCKELGFQFMNYFFIQSDSGIENAKLDFEDHWNKEHSEIKTKNKMKVDANSQIQSYSASASSESQL